MLVVRPIRNLRQPEVFGGVLWCLLVFKPSLCPVYKVELRMSWGTELWASRRVFLLVRVVFILHKPEDLVLDRR